MKNTQTLVGVALAIAASLAGAECLSDAQVADLVASWKARTPAANPQGQSEADAACSRAKFTAALGHGRVIGYKAGLTNPAVQKRFNASGPVWGTLFEGMVLKDGATVEAAFGARPLFEADLLVRVKSEAINEARTPMEVLLLVDQVIPFIELPDLVVQAPAKLDGPAISAINVGARLGVAGQPIPVPATRGELYALLDGLQNMTVTLADAGSGTTLGQGRGSDVLGHPLNAVVYLAQALKQEGLKMRAGDLISLGSFSPLLPPRAGQKVSVTYTGLPGAQPVSVSFR